MLISKNTLLLSALFLCLLSHGTMDSLAQQRRNPPSPGTNTGANAPGTASGAATGASAASKATPDKLAPNNVKTPLTPDDLLGAIQEPEDAQGDYIPCKFQLAQLRGLVLPDIAPSLSAGDSERLKERIIAAALGTSKAANGVTEALSQFVDAIAKESFTGRTPGEALNLLIQDLNKYKLDIQASPSKEIGNDDLTSDLAKLREGLTKETLDKNQLLLFTSHTPAIDIANWAITSGTALTEREAATLKPLVENENKAQSKEATTTAVLNVARKTIALAERPTDVGCAMSILDWKETSQAFGHVIANEYIAIQVVVRNLNRDQQFILHDIEFQVNSDPTGRLGRFFSGRDKVIVRALSSSQTIDDPRNIVVHSASGVAHLLSAIAPFTVPGVAVTYAASAMGSTLVPDLDRYWKDLTTDQAHLLDDVGFSSTANTQSVVPKSGTAMYVIFTPARPFEEGWWTLPCVETQYLGSVTHSRHLVNIIRDDANTVLEEQGSVDPVTSKPIAPLRNGVDVARALEGCLAQPLNARDTRKWYRGFAKSGDKGRFDMPSGLLNQLIETSDQCEALELQAKKKQNGTPDLPSACTDLKPETDVFRNSYRNPYHHWTPNAQAVFREISNTVVAGMHITEDQQLAPVVTEVKCPHDGSGNIQLPTTGTDLTCPVTGKNMSKINKLRLRNSKVPTETVTAEGLLSISGDPSSGNVKFSLADLRALTAAQYDVFGVSLNGAETKTSVVFNFDATPTIISFDKPLDFHTGIVSLAYSIIGTHLGATKMLTFSAVDKPDPATNPGSAIKPAEPATIGVADPAAKPAKNVKNIPLVVSESLITGELQAVGFATAGLSDGPLTLTLLDANGKTVAKSDGKVTLTNPPKPK